MIVVDTTVWIDFFTGAVTPEDRHLQQLITAGRSLALTDLIFCEIRQGIREDAACERTRRLLRVCPILRLERLATFEHAARISRTCCRKRPRYHIGQLWLRSFLLFSGELTDLSQD